MTNNEPQLEVALRELVKGSSISEVCHSLYDLLAVPIRILDADNELLAEASKSEPPCEYLCGFEKGRRLCAKQRNSVQLFQPRASESNLSDCFCGLRYLTVPLVFQNELVGKIVVGPYLPEELERIPEDTHELDARVDLPTLSSKFGFMGRLSTDTAGRIAATLSALTEVILFSAHKAHLTSEMHLATIRESYRELTQKNRELEAMADERKEFERLRANFLATISHELRTPLTSIIGYSDMLAEGIGGSLGEEQQQFVETIKSKGDELLKLIGSILDFSQLDAGHMQLQFDLVAPDQILDQIVQSHQASAERRGVRLSVQTADDLDPIRLDPGKLSSALGHLIENAIKFSSPGGVVKVSARSCPADDSDITDDGIGFVLMTTPQMLEFAVEDFGLGIDVGAQTQIFEPFSQIDNSSTREHGGAGLGLAIVKHYVEAHGGRITVSSITGKGSKFVIRLPITASE